MDGCTDISDCLDMSELLLHIWQQRDGALSSQEKQCWDVVEQELLEAPNMAAFRKFLNDDIQSNRSSTYRLTLRVALAHLEEACTPSPAHA